MKRNILMVPLMALLFSFAFVGCYATHHNDPYYHREYKHRHHHHDRDHDRDRDRDRDRDDYESHRY